MRSLAPPAMIHTVHDDGKLRLLSQGSVLALCNREPPSLTGLATLVAALDALQAERGGRVSLVVVPAADPPRLVPEVARAIAEAWAARDPIMACGAAWLRRTGFFAAALRSLVTGVLLSRPSSATPIRVSDDGDEVARFVERHGEQARGVRELLDAVVA